MAKNKPDKREAILEATLGVVVERGFHDAPLSLISKRARASPGVIYHYFAGKEDIIEALYERTTALKRRLMLEGYTVGMAAHEATIHVWMNAYRYYRQYRREMRFLEQCEAAGFVYPPAKKDLPDPVQAEFEKQFRSRAQGGVLNDLPAFVLQEITLGLAARLARQKQPLTESEQRQVAEKVWQFIGT